MRSLQEVYDWIIANEPSTRTKLVISDTPTEISAVVDGHLVYFNTHVTNISKKKILSKAVEIWKEECITEFSKFSDEATLDKLKKALEYGHSVRNMKIGDYATDVLRKVIAVRDRFDDDESFRVVHAHVWTTSEYPSGSHGLYLLSSILDLIDVVISNR